MPKSKEFVDSSDSASDQESSAAVTSNKTKVRDSNSENHVSSFRESVFYLFLCFFDSICYLD